MLLKNSKSPENKEVGDFFRILVIDLYSLNGFYGRDLWIVLFKDCNVAWQL